MAPLGTGTMAEGAGGLAPLPLSPVADEREERPTPSGGW